MKKTTRKTLSKLTALIKKSTRKTLNLYLNYYQTERRWCRKNDQEIRCIVLGDAEERIANYCLMLGERKKAIQFIRLAMRNMKRSIRIFSCGLSEAELCKFNVDMIRSYERKLMGLELRLISIILDNFDGDITAIKNLNNSSEIILKD